VEDDSGTTCVCVYVLGEREHNAMCKGCIIKAPSWLVATWPCMHKANHGLSGLGLTLH